MNKQLCLWIARLVFVAMFTALMVYEWNRWPNGSPLLGPLGIIWYNGVGGEYLAMSAVSIVLVFAYLIKPNFNTALVSAIGVMNWCFWGVVAQGIGC